MSKLIKLFCPSCGHQFEHSPNFKGKVVGGSSGLISGAILGAKVGIAGGPLGAIAGTIPGAVLGGIFGKNFGNKFDKPKCPSCSNSFEIPNNKKKSYTSGMVRKTKLPNSNNKEIKFKDKPW